MTSSHDHTPSIAELSVPLDYADLKKVRLFSRVFGLDFKITEGMLIVG